MGTPARNVVDKVLEPVLKELVCALAPGNFIWGGTTDNDSHDSNAFLSLDVKSETTTTWEPDEQFSSLSKTLVHFPHPLREDVVRVIVVLSKLSMDVVIKTLLALQPIRGEVWVANALTTEMSAALGKAGLSSVTVLDSEGKNEGSHCAGYMLHSSSKELLGVDSY